MQYTYWDFFPLLKTVFELVDFDAFLVLLLFFVLPLLQQQNISFSGLFPQGNKNVSWDEIRWIGRVGHGCDAVFVQKLLNTQSGIGQVHS